MIPAITTLPGWNGLDSETILLQQLNRRQNTNRVMKANPQTGKVVTLLTERDDAWVDVVDELFWSSDKQTFTWISQRDGWRHVYRSIADNGDTERITSGDYDVIKLLHVDETEDCIYFLASPDNACQQYLYRANRTEPTWSELLRTVKVARFNTAFRPTDVPPWSPHLPPSVPHALNSSACRSTARSACWRTTPNCSRVSRRLDRADMEFFRVDIGGGVQLDAWCIRPPKFEPRSKYPLLVHVYGEPAGQTVLDRWGGSNYLWHLMLAQRGYVVMSFDNRGTPAPRGRAWRKCVYRKVGILAPQDQAAAVRTVLQRTSLPGSESGWRLGLEWRRFDDAERHVQISRISTRSAIAVAPVANQRYYDTIYQERYMGLPQDNADGYLQGSPINFAKQLQGNLLLDSRHG